MSTSTAFSSKRRVGETLVQVKFGVPLELDRAARELAAARRVSLASIHSEALRAYIQKATGQDDRDSVNMLILRKLDKMDRKQDGHIEMTRVGVETQGVSLQLQLGSFKHFKTEQEQKQFTSQVAERLPPTIERIVDSLRVKGGEFMRLFLRTKVASALDFPDPADERGGSSTTSGGGK